MIVVDASLALKWLFEEDYSAKAEALAVALTRRGEPMIAPPLLPVEVTNTLRQRIRQGTLTLAQARERLRVFLAYRVWFVAPADLYERSLLLADAQNLRAVYDAQYLALAEIEGCECWTADQRLLRALATPLPFARFIGDYEDDTVDVAP